MSFLTLIHHPDPDRRQSFTKRAIALATECCPQLKVQPVAAGHSAAVIAVSHPTLLRVTPDDSGGLQTVMGQMTTHRCPNARNRWPAAFTPGQDEYPGGYFAAFSVSANATLALGADRWGLYPIYFTKLPDGCVLVASSPAFMQADSTYREAIDPAGLCGLLLLNGLVNNRSVFKNVTRLPAGTILTIDRDGDLRVSAEPPPPTDDGWSALNRNEAVQRLGALWTATLKRLQPDKTSLIFLSGGIDSRMVTGGLSQCGSNAIAYTMGQPGDYERIAAKAVAKAAGIRWIGAAGEPPAREACNSMRWLARWSGLSGGFSAGNGWSVRPRALQRTVYGWSGIALDDVLGGKTADYVDIHTGQDPALVMFTRLNEWGIAPEILAKMFRKCGLDRLPADVIETFRQSFPLPGYPLEAARFMAKLRYRARFHLGNVMWMSSFQCWPIIPALEPEIMEAGFHLSPAVMTRRSLQRAYLQLYHPEFQHIPIDRNSHDFSSFGGQSYRDWLGWLYRQDRRRYYRIFSPEHPSWQRIRLETERSRHLLLEFFDEALLQQCWPAAGQSWKCTTPFGDPAGGKNLMAVAWRLAGG